MNKATITALKAMTLPTLTALYNGAVTDFGAPAGMGEVDTFKSKADAVARLRKLCEHGNVAVQFDGDTAVIVDASLANVSDYADASLANVSDYADAAPNVVAFGDGKGVVAPSGFTRASDVWLKSHARGTPEREAYRKARRQAARAARKAKADA